MGPRRFPKIIKATRKKLPIGNLEKTNVPVSALEKPISAEENALREKLEVLAALEKEGIKPGSMDQLHKYPETIGSIGLDPDLAKWGGDLGRALRHERNLAQLAALENAKKPKIPDEPKRSKILTKEEMSKKREEDAAIQRAKERQQKEIEEGKAEGVRNIDLSKLKATGLGGAAIGAGMLADTPSAHAAEGPTVSQSNPEFKSSPVSKPFALPSFAEKALKTQAFLGKMEEEGKLAPDVTSYLYDTAYKYGIDPAKRKVMGLLTGKDISEDETPSYSDIYKQGFENIGKENVGKFLKGFASSAAEDPTGTTQDLIQSAKDEDVADYVANTAAGVSELAEDPLAPVMAGAGKLSKTIRTLSKFRPK